MARPNPHNTIRFIIRGNMLPDTVFWQMEVDYLADGAVLTAAAFTAAQDFANTVQAGGLALARAALASRAVLYESDTVITDDSGLSQNYVDDTFAGAGTWPTTGQDTPTALAAVVQRSTGFLGRGERGRTIWPVGESSMLDTVDQNNLAGGMRSALQTWAGFFLNPITVGPITWSPCIFHLTRPPSVTFFTKVVIPVTWRRSRKVGVGR